MANNTQKFRASFTVLSQWAGGNWERAVKTYFKLEKFATPEMVEGREWHKKWAEHIAKTKTLPVEFGGGKLTAPAVENKTVVQLADWLDLVGMIDCYDRPVVYEWKTGKQSSEAYANSKQGGIYGVLATYSKMYVEKVEIHRYDQYKKQADMSIVWVTDELLADAYNWIITYSSEMHSYFQQNDFYSRFGPALYANNQNNG